MTDLACVGRDDLFFPEDDDYNTARTETAKRLCYACPMFDICRAVGIENQEEHGVWGGLTPDERRSFAFA